MIKNILGLVILFSFCRLASADETEKIKYWIFFKDKGETYVESNILSKEGSFYNKAVSSLSLRSIDRRSRQTEPVQIDYKDIPVSQDYISNLEKRGIRVQNVSKWFNGVTAYLDETQVLYVKSLNFVKELKPVGILKGKTDDLQSIEKSQTDNTFYKSASKFNYGNSFTQNQMINVPKVHDVNINGFGVLVGMMDTGFDWKTPAALNKRKVLREYDFIFQDSVTANQSMDASSQDSHGTLCFSVLAGFVPDTLIGPSYNSEFILAKTEDVRSEKKVEEDNWVAAVEWMESLGVDVISSSLGYNEFNNPLENYTYQNMDGNTAIITKAADIAVDKGIVVVTSAGNEGNSAWKYITAPADGKKVIAVGAAMSNGNRASFSSFGPTYDGRIKPDVSALGYNVYHAVTGTKSFYSYSNGTSLSCPLVAGVAALVVSARPDLTPAKVTEALKNTASLAETPNNELGWGIIDAYKAITYNGVVFSNEPIIEKSESGVKVSTYIASSKLINKNSVKVFYSLDGGAYNQISMTIEGSGDEFNSGLYSATLPMSAGAKDISCYFTATDEKGERKNPYNAPQKIFRILDVEKLPQDLPEEFRLYQNYPNPFNPSTEIKFDVLQSANVTLRIYNSAGQLTKTLINENLKPNSYSVVWNGKDDRGKQCSSGTYFYRLESGNHNVTKKMSLIK